MTRELAISILVGETIGTTEQTREAVKMAVDALKADVPDTNVGKWVATEKGLRVTKYECSKCKRLVIDDTGYDVTKDFPFCHCGADMRGEEE